MAFYSIAFWLAALGLYLDTDLESVQFGSAAAALNDQSLWNLSKVTRREWLMSWGQLSFLLSQGQEQEEFKV